MQLVGVCQRYWLSSLLLRFHLQRDALGKRAPQLYQRLKIILASAEVYLSTHFIGSPKLSFFSWCT